MKSHQLVHSGLVHADAPGTELDMAQKKLLEKKALLEHTILEKTLALIVQHKSYRIVILMQYAYFEKPASLGFFTLANHLMAFLKSNFSAYEPDVFTDLIQTGTQRFIEQSILNLFYQEIDYPKPITRFFNQMFDLPFWQNIHTPHSPSAGTQALQTIGIEFLENRLSVANLKILFQHAAFSSLTHIKAFYVDRYLQLVKLSPKKEDLWVLNHLIAALPQSQAELKKTLQSVGHLVKLQLGTTEDVYELHKKNMPQATFVVLKFLIAQNETVSALYLATHLIMTLRHPELLGPWQVSLEEQEMMQEFALNFLIKKSSEKDIRHVNNTSTFTQSSYLLNFFKTNINYEKNLRLIAHWYIHVLKPTSAITWQDVNVADILLTLPTLSSFKLRFAQTFNAPVTPMQLAMLFKYIYTSVLRGYQDAMGKSPALLPVVSAGARERITNATNHIEISAKPN